LLEPSHELAKENGAPIAQNGPVLLRAVRLDRQGAIAFYSALKHNGSWLVDGDLLVSKHDVKVGAATV